jgi:toxin ParE1/3/4
MIVHFTDPAITDIEELADWIALDNPMRAASFSRELRERCLGLTQFPERFPAFREIDGYALRKMSHGNFLVFYAILDRQIDIVRVLRGSRDWERLLSGEQ